MEHKVFKHINENYKTMNNSELKAIMDNLYNDFELTKKSIIELTLLLEEIGETYDKVYDEISNRYGIN
jgi:hypothetical protein